MSDCKSIKFIRILSSLCVGMLFLSACESGQETEISVSVARTQVSSASGSHIVSVIASGPWVLSLYSEAGPVDWAELSETQGSGNTNRVVLSYEANESSDSRTLMIILTSGGQDASCTFEQSGVQEERPDPDPDPDEPEAVPVWMELPAMSADDGKTFVSHPMTIGRIPTRNYSLYWDRENLVAQWVAYPLNAWSIGTGDRTDRWGYDPLIPEEDQPRLYGGYRGGYQRGHQIASADRLQYDANVQTFYFTNMTPQLGELNGQIWADLEGSVRSWARSSDTLYVVTGCVTEGSTDVAYDNDGKAVTVPVGYFKALLRYSRSSTIGYSGYAGAAFYLEHRGYSEAHVTAEMSMSIDELEEMTGIDFFVNLPDAIGETAASRVEAQQPSAVSWWW